MQWPMIHSVRQRWDQPQVKEVAAEVRRQVQQSHLRRRVRPGGRVAIAVGSRGIANLVELVAGVIDAVRELCLEPFIVAAMGSHGGATAEGQRQLLENFGLGRHFGIPICTDMAAVPIGVNSWNEPVYWDRHALAADAVVAVARIKPHTDFHGRYESGIVKMLAIGLGKREGAAVHHRYGVRGLRDMIPETARVVLAKTPFALGLAILENAAGQTAVIHAVEPEELLEVEPLLLEQARSMQARLPFTTLDLLVVGEIGKNYSGTGMDVHVLGRQLIEAEPDTCDPRITRICALDLSPESQGNAVGAGLADLITQRIIDKMDKAKTDTNYFTSCFLLRAKMPPAFATDRACMEMGLQTCWQPHSERVRLAIIPNTLELGHLWASRPAVDELHGRPGVVVDGDAIDIPFSPSGSLNQAALFPDSIRGRRSTQ